MMLPLDIHRHPGTRRKFIRHVFAWLACAGSISIFAADAPTAIGSQRELFVDDTLIERVTGSAELRLHHPEPREIALVHDAPWEGSGCVYHSVFRDGDRYRMYYRTCQIDVSAKGVSLSAHPQFLCYAESDDGIHWRKPELGLHDFKGSTANNIVIPSGKLGEVTVDAGSPAVFKDENPAAPPEARYKALLRSSGVKGLIAFQSADGLHWSPLQTEPVITAGAFDSQNLAFWDAARGEYRAYWRIFTAGVTEATNWKPGGYRAIRTATSTDFVHWSTKPTWSTRIPRTSTSRSTKPTWSTRIPRTSTSTPTK
ncbi:MAG: hypothetical protein P4L99_08715 [Chthoniobacter sp.]|nr:hypothetical protein [Chthoniobacter sp.]